MVDRHLPANLTAHVQRSKQESPVVYCSDVLKMYEFTKLIPDYVGIR